MSKRKYSVQESSRIYHKQIAKEESRDIDTDSEDAIWNIGHRLVAKNMR